MITLFGRSISPSGNLSASPVMVNNSSISDDLSYAYSPLVHPVVNNVEASKLTKPNISSINGTQVNERHQNNDHEAEKNGVPDSSFEPKKVQNLLNESTFDKFVALDKINSTLENVNSSFDISTSENAREPGPGVFQDQGKQLGSNFLPYSDRPAAMGPMLESVGIADAGFSSISPASPPETSPNGSTLLRELDANLTTSGLSIDSNLSSVKNLVPEIPSKIENPGLLGSAPVAANISNKLNGDLMMREKGAHVSPISKMNSLLLQSYDSFHSMTTEAFRMRSGTFVCKVKD